MMLRMPAGRPIGQVASAYGACLRVEILESAEGFYIGTREDDLPFTRESVEYYPSRAAAERALRRRTWTQRVGTVQAYVPASMSV